MSHQLSFSRLIDAAPETLFRLWTDPTRLHEWFCPKPWTVAEAEMDVRPGGKSNMVMKGPNGETMPNHGQFLEIVPNRRIVFTDAFTGDWEPKDGAPFFVGVVEFTPEDGKTRYTCTVRHWTEQACREHEERGFYQGWGIAADQLEALAKSL